MRTGPRAPGVDDSPSWSGREIVFVSDRRNPGRVGGFPSAGQGGPQHEVYLMNADGSDVRRVTTTDQRDQWPHMSPNGKQVVFTRDLESPTLCVLVLPAPAARKQTVTQGWLFRTTSVMLGHACGRPTTRVIQP